MTFLPSEHHEAVQYGCLVEIDVRTGTFTLHGGIPRPQTERWNSTDNDAIDLLGLLPLENDRVALYGGFGTGPYQWWIAKERLNGGLLWQAVGGNSVGGITALQVVPGGYDASAYVSMSSPDPSAVGAYRLRFDDAEKLVSAAKMARNGRLLFLADGSAALIGTGDPPMQVVEDPQGSRRTLAVLPRGATLLGRLDDGSWMLERIMSSPSFKSGLPLASLLRPLRPGREPEAGRAPRRRGADLCRVLTMDRAATNCVERVAATLSISSHRRHTVNGAVT
jgi:hypothetical protein